MATTTTQPYLYRIQVTKLIDGPPNFLVRSWWRGNLLATAELVEIVSENTVNSDDFQVKSNLDGWYADAYEIWTALTGDDTHTAGPFTTYPTAAPTVP